MIFKVDVGEAVEDFAGSGTHVPMWTPEFREHVRNEERFHHAEDGGSLFGDDMAH